MPSYPRATTTNSNSSSSSCSSDDSTTAREDDGSGPLYCYQPKECLITPGLSSRARAASIEGSGSIFSNLFGGSSRAAVADTADRQTAPATAEVVAVVSGVLQICGGEDSCTASADPIPISSATPVSALPTCDEVSGLASAEVEVAPIAVVAVAASESSALATAEGLRRDAAQSAESSSEGNGSSGGGVGKKESKKDGKKKKAKIDSEKEKEKGKLEKLEERDVRPEEEKAHAVTDQKYESDTVKMDVSTRPSTTCILPPPLSRYTSAKPLSLCFQPHAFFALGSPLGLFMSIRSCAFGLAATLQDQSETLFNADFSFPTCASFYNIYHPHDPVAYRVEPLLHPELRTKPAAVVPHHKNKLRFHYQVRYSMSKISDQVNDGISKVSELASDVSKQIGKIFNFFGSENKEGNSNAEAEAETEVEVVSTKPNNPSSKVGGVSAASSSDENEEMSKDPGLNQRYPKYVPSIRVNSGRRVDYMLQETQVEGSFEYISSLTGHTEYFNLEDVARFVVVHTS